MILPMLRNPQNLASLRFPGQGYHGAPFVGWHRSFNQGSPDPGVFIQLGGPRITLFFGGRCGRRPTPMCMRFA